MSKLSCARFGACTHEWRNADPAGTDPRSGGDEARGLPQRHGRACGAGAGAIEGRSVLGLIFCFRAKRADKVKLIFWDGTGLCLFAKRLEGGKFRWPRIEDGVMRLSAAQLAALLEGVQKYPQG